LCTSRVLPLCRCCCCFLLLSCGSRDCCMPGWCFYR
jgi:hypothetical protein